jgi:hypothetical protein
MRNSFRRLRLTRVNGAFGRFRLSAGRDFSMIKKVSGVGQFERSRRQQRETRLANGQRFNSELVSIF